MSRLRSCTSSTTMCVMQSSAPSAWSWRSSTPVVQNTNRDLSLMATSPLTTCPTVFPGVPSPLSSATRPATPVAARRRGWVTTILAPAGSSSRMNCGTCVDFPHPVSPVTNRTLPDASACFMSDRNFALDLCAGRDLRAFSIEDGTFGKA